MGPSMKHQMGVLLVLGVFLGSVSAAVPQPQDPEQIGAANVPAPAMTAMGTKADFVVAREPPPGPLPYDYNPETNIVWSDESELGVTVEAIIAFIWISMVASMPAISLKLEGRSITKVQIIIFIVMWIVFLGGIYLFNQVLLFQSVHFKTVRSLTIVETVYLMSQILTTVGYGDITPAKPRGQVFVGIYVIISVLIILNVVTDVTSTITDRLKNYASTLDDSSLGLGANNLLVQRLQHKMFSGSETQQTPEEAKQSLIKQWRTHNAPPLPYGPLVKSIIGYLFFVMLGCLFFVNYPGENRTVFQGVYMSIITLSTVGFGAFTPLTEAGKVFGAFWMLFGSGALVAVVSSFTELMLATKLRQQFDPLEAQKEEEELLANAPENMSRYDFTKFGLLRTKKVTEEDIQRMEELFSHMDSDSDGTVERSEALAFMHAL